MPYNQDQNWLFIHIPKTAGGSITTALRGNTGTKKAIRPRANKLKMGSLAALRNSTQLVGRGDLAALHGAYPYTLSLEHLTYRTIQLLELIPEESLNAAFKFTVVRNPWQRALSSFYSHNRSKAYNNFEDFCLNWFDDQSGFSHDELAHRRPQNDFITDLDGNNAMDLILRYESLSEDFDQLLEKLGLDDKSLPHLHKRSGKHSKDYRSHYTDKAKEKVSQLFECDIDFFKYTF